VTVGAGEATADPAGDPPQGPTTEPGPPQGSAPEPERPQPNSADPSGGRGNVLARNSFGRKLVARNLTRQTVLATDVESADGLWAKFMGLMGRDALAPGAALWLPDSNGIHMMFMRFAIDAVFVGKPDADGARVVVSVHEALPAWRGLVPLVRGAHGVLELPSGVIAASGTAVGDRISLERPAD
jgi:uncharacterized membrane protein (UPF0127 family)